MRSFLPQVQLAGVHREVADVRAKLRLLQGQSLYADLFDQYEAEIGRLMAEVSGLHDKQVAMMLAMEEGEDEEEEGAPGGSAGGCTGNMNRRPWCRDNCSLP